MANPNLANFLQHYNRHTRGHQETEAERGARIDAWEALPPLEKAVASVLYILDNQVGGAKPDASVTFFASSLQRLADQLHEALTAEAIAPEPALQESVHQEL
jgi:hypothetical protein